MDRKPETDPASARTLTRVERRSDRELVVTRRFAAPPRLVFDAWTRPELLKLWWAPKSSGMALLSVDADVRTGGSYRFEFGRDGTVGMAFFGRYLELVPPSRIVWTNEEGEDGAVSTLTLEEHDGGTLLTLSEVYPSKAALDRSMDGMEDGMPEQFEQLDALLPTLGAGQA